MYIQDVDVLEEGMKEWNTETRKAMRTKLPEGVVGNIEIFGAWDDRCYRDPTPEEAGKIGWGSGRGNGLSWDSRVKMINELRSAWRLSESFPGIIDGLFREAWGK